MRGSRLLQAREKPIFRLPFPASKLVICPTFAVRPAERQGEGDDAVVSETWALGLPALVLVRPLGMIGADGETRYILYRWPGGVLFASLAHIVHVQLVPPYLTYLATVHTR